MPRSPQPRAFRRVYTVVIRRLLLSLLLSGAAAGAAGTSSALAAGDFVIQGGGFGHGIGMSQYGAYGYAQAGYDYRYILTHYFEGTSLGQTDPAQTVRVLLRTGHTASFAGAASAAGKKLHSDQTYTVKLQRDGSLLLVDSSGHKVAHVQPPLVATGTGPLDVPGLGLYRGALEFRPDGGGGVQTVNALGLDDYVRGVISVEMPSSWPAQALEAHAVAARTYAITTSVAGNGYTLYPDTRSQMYGGVSAETSATDAAVAATSGQIVTYNGSAVTTYFFSSSGGHTENVEDVWAGAAAAPWLRGVSDPYDSAGGQNPYYRWTDTLSVASAARKLRGVVRGSFIGIRVVKHGASPRIVQAVVVGSAGTVQVGGYQLQSAFGLLSTYASFTTITTLPGRGSVHQSRKGAPRPRRRSGSSGGGATQKGSQSGGSGLGSGAPSSAASSSGASGGAGILGLMRALHALSAAGAPAVHGFVFPGRPGDQVQVQQRTATGWATITQTSLDANGAYSVGLPAHGSYRVVYKGLAAPAVNV